jgi:hypothetical protein
VGAYALLNGTSASQNVGVGYSALATTSTGASNVGIGWYAVSSNTSGTNNVGVGKEALKDTSGGNNNTALGTEAAKFLQSGSNNTCLGYQAAPSTVSVSNEITLGNSSVTTLRCQATSITSLSDARDKANIVELDAGLDFAMGLKPVRFDWNKRDKGKVGVNDTGFIAQDLRQLQIDKGVVIPNLVYDANPEQLEASYGMLIPVLVKAIQELKAEFDAYKTSHP